MWICDSWGLLERISRPVKALPLPVTSHGSALENMK